VNEVLPLLSPVLTRREAKAILRHGIAYPLFVPSLGGSVVRILASGDGPKALAEELNRMTLLGSDNAAALLTLLVTRGEFDASQFLSSAEERCHAAALAGHAYAQYVMSCVHRKQGKHSQAFACLRSSMAGKFLPSFIDYARFGASGPGATLRDNKNALKILWAAHKLGHRGALTFIGRLWLRGAGGWPARFVSLPVYLFAVFRAAHYAARHPLSEKVFILPPINERLLRGRRK
jgi:hypothetical protein